MVADDILLGLVCACAVAVMQFCASAADSAYMESVARVVECEIDGSECTRIAYAYWSDLEPATHSDDHRRIDDMRVMMGGGDGGGARGACVGFDILLPMECRETTFARRRRW